MDDKELRELQDNVLAMCQRHPEDIDGTFSILLRIISALISERRVVTNLASKIQVADSLLLGEPTDLDRKPGLAYTVNEMARIQKRNQKLLGSVLSGVIVVIAIEALKIVIPHIK